MIKSIITDIYQNNIYKSNVRALRVIARNTQFFYLCSFECLRLNLNKRRINLCEY